MAWRGRRRIRTGRLQKQRQAWDVGLFDDSTDRTGGAVMYGMFTPSDMLTSGSMSFRMKIRRVVCNGQLAIVPQLQTASTLTGAILYALVVIEEDDTDSNINTTAAGSLLRDNRVLHVGAFTYGVVEAPSTQAASQTQWGAPINIDWKGQAWLRENEALGLIVQCAQNISTEIALIRTCFYSRVLYDIP